MKKFLPALLVAIFIFTCLAVVACDKVSFVDVEKQFEKCNTEQHWTVSDGATIRISTDTFSVYFRKSNTDQVSVNYVQNSKFSISGEVKTDNGEVLEVVQTDLKKVNISARNRFLVVTLPASLKNCILQVDCSVGAIQIEDFQFASLLLSATTGSIYVDNTTVLDSVNLQTTTGSIHAELDATSIVATATTGSIYLEGEIVEKVKATATTGSIKVEVETVEVELAASTGSIKFDLDAVKISAQTTTGSISGKIKNPKQLFTIDASTTTGSCKVSNQQGQGDYLLYLRATTGSISVDFDK